MQHQKTIWGCLLFMAVTIAHSAATESGRVEFSRDVLPILSDNCFQCHGPDPNKARQGELRLDDEADVKRQRDGYRVIDVDHPKASKLIERILATDDERMPPPELGRILSAGQIDTLRRWVEQGAPWSRHWAFDRIERPELKLADFHPIDALTGRRLAEAELKPNDRASKRALIRRLKYDLTGLPPTIDEVTEFLKDKKPGSWERLVDRTLASRAYGERMAWDWLELARYADSNGYQGDGDRTMWPWRDWVVRAFNDNLSYDKFTTWQLAGDLLPGATKEQILATGFNRNHMINGEGGRIAAENRIDYVMDMTETMATVWLGLTVNCCRCHDHKFDPVKQREYYQLTAFFNQTPVDGGGGNPQTPPVMAYESETQLAELKSTKSQLAKTQTHIDARRKQLDVLQGDWETATTEKPPASDWKVIHPSTAEADTQKLEINEQGRVLASGKNPVQDTYQLTYKMIAGNVTGFKLDAIRHSSMTKGRLARSDSGNFVLTNLQFQLRRHGNSNLQKLEISKATATYEQGGLPIALTFDSDPKSGWAVWNGKSIDRDHAGVFQLKTPFTVTAEDELLVSMEFKSAHAHHNLGHFSFSFTEDPKPKLENHHSQLLAALKVARPERSKTQHQVIRDAFEASDSKLVQLKQDQATASKRERSIRSASPKVMVMKDLEKLRTTYMLERGLYNKPGEVVTAGVPATLPPLAEKAKPDRLALARWLVSREHPLMARVTVNRIWQMFFGIGLVKTVDDFGIQGEYPIHRELLDWLAIEFIESGWDVKHLIRTIVTSQTYQRSSKITSVESYEQDPDNRLLARGPRFRLPAWMIRDQALATSGLLNATIGGKPVFPYQPQGIWSEATFGKKKYPQSKGESLYRRSLYTFWRRIVGPPIFFDAAKRQNCEVKPMRTNTPMHALTTFNAVTYVEAARVLAEKVLKQTIDDDDRMQMLGLLVLSREPTSAEERIWKSSIERAAAVYKADSKAARRFISNGDSKSDTDIPVETLAAWTSLCLNLFNLDESLTKE